MPVHWRVCGSERAGSVGLGPVIATLKSPLMAR
jgi:hypothetical protein